MEYLNYIVIALILLIVAIAITNSKKKDFKVKDKESFWPKLVPKANDDKNKIKKEYFNICVF